MRKPKTKATDKTLLKLYAEGLTYRETANHTGMTYLQAQARMMQRLRDRIRTLREQRSTMKVIGRELGIARSQVYRYLQAIGLE